jgi:predicted nucleotidyltransferase component of viral defense system
MLSIQTVKPECLALLKELMNLKELKDFRLAGGTALSLRLGHRVSIDLDLFTNQRFEVTEFITYLKTYFNERIKIGGSNRYGVFTSINGIKVDFLYRYEKFINEEDIFDDLRISSLEDIGAMKIQAAASRVSKKDYYDLFELLNVYTFAELLDFYSKMYANHDVGSMLKSMTDFSELDQDEEPVSLRTVSWDIIKDRISTEIRNYIHLLQKRKINAEEERQKAIKEIISRKKNKN